MRDIEIVRCAVSEAYSVSMQIPEFEPWYPWEKWKERLAGREVISLLARIEGKMAGCKVGYFEEDHFYSWIGGIIPEYRRMGIAERLANVQEEMVKNKGCHLIRMKTRNRFTNMLHFALSHGFYISDVEQRGEPADWRITLYKNV